MKQHIISVSLNNSEYSQFILLKDFYTNDVYQLSNSEVFKVAMLEHLKQKKKEVK